MKRDWRYGALAAAAAILSAMTAPAYADEPLAGAAPTPALSGSSLGDSLIGGAFYFSPLPGIEGIGLQSDQGFNLVNRDMSWLRVELSLVPEPAAGFNSLRGKDTLGHWRAGGHLGFDVPYAGGALVVGGSYRSGPTIDIDGLQPGFAALVNRTRVDDMAWDASLKYEFGRWTIGGSYLTGGTSLLNAMGSHAGRAYALEGGYNLGAGVALSAGVQVWDEQSRLASAPVNRSSVSGDKYTVIFLETEVDF